MNNKAIHSNHSLPPSLIQHNNLLREQMSMFLKSLHAHGYTYYVTFRSRPVASRRHLEGMIKEWSKRLNRRFIGRHWWKDSHEHLRMNGIVFFEERPDCHAHAIIKPPVSGNHTLTPTVLIRAFENQWNVRIHPGEYGFKKPSIAQAKERERAVKNSVNQSGDCLTQKLIADRSSMRACNYSLKQAWLLSSTAFDDFKFIENLESYLN